MVECLVVIDGEVDKLRKFVTLPRIGEQIALPGFPHAHKVHNIVHFPDGDQASQHVQLHLKKAWWIANRT